MNQWTRSRENELISYRYHNSLTIYAHTHIDIVQSTLKILMCMCHKDKVTWGLLIGTWILSIERHIIGLYCFICLFALASGIEICDIWYILMWYSGPKWAGQMKQLLSVCGNFPSSRKVFIARPLTIPKRAQSSASHVSIEISGDLHLLVRLIVPDFEKCPQISQ